MRQEVQVKDLELREARSSESFRQQLADSRQAQLDRVLVEREQESRQRDEALELASAARERGDEPSSRSL